MLKAHHALYTSHSIPHTLHLTTLLSIRPKVSFLPPSADEPGDEVKGHRFSRVPKNSRRSHGKRSVVFSSGDRARDSVSPRRFPEVPSLPPLVGGACTCAHKPLYMHTLACNVHIHWNIQPWAGTGEFLKGGGCCPLTKTCYMYQVVHIPRVQKSRNVWYTCQHFRVSVERGPLMHCKVIVNGVLIHAKSCLASDLMFFFFFFFFF